MKIIQIINKGFIVIDSDNVPFIAAKADITNRRVEVLRVGCSIPDLIKGFDPLKIIWLN